MDRRHLLLAAALSPFLASGARAQDGFKLKRLDEPAVLPEIRYLDPAGNETALGALAGRVVILNLWATWCLPCREEMPSLDRLQANYPKDRLTVLALSVDRASQDQVEAFLKEVGATNLTLGLDPKNRVPRLLKVPGLPATLVIDKQGREIGRLYGGAAWDGPEAAALIDGLLAA